MWDQVIIYEQPLNEHIRACLRLEHLFNKIQHSLSGTSEWDDRSSISTIINISNLVDRGDLRTKFSKELRRHKETLIRHSQMPDVDDTALNYFLTHLERCEEQLNSSSGRMGHAIRENDFLNSVKQYLHNPGGACNSDAPALQNWLYGISTEQKKTDITNWLGSFAILQDVVQLLLQLTRESAISEKKLALGGFYQESLDPQAPSQLIRVVVPKSSMVYPVISAGRHRISVHFYNHCASISRPSQTTEDISFKLACCII